MLETEVRDIVNSSTTHPLQVLKMAIATQTPQNAKAVRLTCYMQRQGHCNERRLRGK